MSRLGDRVVAAEDDRDRAGGEHLRDRVLDRDVRADRVGREDRRVAEVDDPQDGAQRVDAGLEVRPGRAAAARIARGPKRVPGASDVSSSIGAPTIAASAPSSSAGSSV